MTLGSSLADAPVTNRQLLKDRSVRNYIAVSFLAEFAVFAQLTALLKYVEDTTDSALNLGLVGLAEFAPAMLLVLVSGAVVDRFDRRRIAAIGYGLEAGCAVALVLYLRAAPSVIWPVFVIAVVMGIGRSFTAPATRSMKVLIAPEGGLSRLVPLATIAWQASGVLGPVVAGLVYSQSRWAMSAVAVVLFVVAALLILGIRYRRPQERDVDDRPTLDQALQGLKFIRRTPILLGAISLDLMAVLFGGAVALLPKIADDVLGVGDVAYGWLRAAPGIGSALIGGLMIVRPLRNNVGRNLLIAVGIFGAATIVLGLTRNYAVAFAALIVLAGADSFSVFIRATLVPLVTPNSMQGRVTAVENVFIGASNELGAFESGVAATLFGLTAAVTGGGVIVLGVAAMWAVLFPAIRRIDTFADAEAQTVLAEADLRA